jgi:GT2 family glycosyltransferase
MTPAPLLSVVITTLNARSTLRACLESLLADLQRADLPYEVIVVDDASTDGSAALVAADFPEVVLVRNAQTAGYSRTNNIGLRRTRGTMIFLLNADTVVQPGCVAALVDALRRRPNAAGVGPTLLNTDGTIQRSCWRFPLRSLIGNSLCLFRFGVWDDYRAWRHHVDRQVDWISTAALLIRRSALDAVGPFDERFWVYGVDIDWALRAARRGFRFASIAAARVVHKGGASWGSASDRKYEDHMRAHSLLFGIHYGSLGLVFFRGTLLANSLVRVLAWGTLSLVGVGPAKPKLAEFARLARWSVRGSTPGTGATP